MSVRLGLLALLETGAMNGYQLRAEFERRTGGTWPLNIGQAYTALRKLERDGLVEAKPGGTSERYSLTPQGLGAVHQWWTTPVDRAAPARDELAIKLSLAVTIPGVDVAAVIQTQRTQTVRNMRDMTGLKRSAGTDPADLAWTLVLDRLIFAAEAEIRWLDHVEAAVLRRASLPHPTEAVPDAGAHPGPSQRAGTKRPALQQEVEA